MATWYESSNPRCWVGGRRMSVDEPCVTVMASGMGGDWLHNWRLCRDGRAELGRVAADAKPPYRVPSMAEVRALPRNGLVVASTFSGCGGSCLGYRMAGYRVAWASEFVPAAQESYEANADEGCVLDRRDVREVRPEEVLAATGLREGELDLLDGSPPCQAFSTAGKRAKGWGKDKVYEHGARQRNESLFDEYVRLLRGLKPRTFVAENVSGLVKGVAKGYFLEILAALKGSGYRVACRLLDAQWLGVPQMRQRAIFVGVREDLGLDPVHPKPFPYRYSVRDALPHVGDARIHWPNNGFRGGESVGADAPVPTVAASAGTVGGNGGTVIGAERRKFTVAELKRLCGFPDDFDLRGTYAQQWARLGNSVPPVMMSHVAAALRDEVFAKLPRTARAAQ